MNFSVRSPSSSYREWISLAANFNSGMVNETAAQIEQKKQKKAANDTYSGKERKRAMRNNEVKRVTIG